MYRQNSCYLTLSAEWSMHQTFGTLLGVRLCFKFHYSYLFFAQVQWNDTMPSLIIHHSCFICFPHWKQRNLPLNDLDLNLVNLLHYTPQIASSRDPRCWWSEARSVTLLDPISHDAIKGHRSDCEKERRWSLGYIVDMLNSCWRS